MSEGVSCPPPRQATTPEAERMVVSASTEAQPVSGRTASAASPGQQCSSTNDMTAVVPDGAATDVPSVTSILICSSCKVQLEHGRHIPRLLPSCLHTICSDCAERNQTGQDNLVCQLCMSASSSATDHPLAEELLQHKQQLRQLCGQCQERGEHATATGNCAECCLDLCADCIHAHKVTRFTWGHTITMTEVPLAEQCSDHLKDLNQYCDTCSVICCKQCIIAAHRGHNSATLETKDAQVRQMLTARLDSVRKMHGVLQKMRDTLQQSLEEAEAEKNAGMERIKSHFNDYEQRVRNFFKDQMTAAAQRYDGYSGEVRRRLEAATLAEVRLRHLDHFSQQLMENARPHTLLSCAAHVTSMARRLRSLELSHETEQTLPRITLKAFLAIDRIGDTMSHLLYDGETCLQPDIRQHLYKSFLALSNFIVRSQVRGNPEFGLKYIRILFNSILSMPQIHRDIYDLVMQFHQSVVASFAAQPPSQASAAAAPVPTPAPAALVEEANITPFSLTVEEASRVEQHVGSAAVAAGSPSGMPYQPVYSQTQRSPFSQVQPEVASYSPLRTALSAPVTPRQQVSAQQRATPQQQQIPQQQMPQQQMPQQQTHMQQYRQRQLAQLQMSQQMQQPQSSQQQMAQQQMSQQTVFQQQMPATQMFTSQMTQQQIHQPQQLYQQQLLQQQMPLRQGSQQQQPRQRIPVQQVLQQHLQQQQQQRQQQMPQQRIQQQHVPQQQMSQQHMQQQQVPQQQLPQQRMQQQQMPQQQMPPQQMPPQQQMPQQQLFTHPQVPQSRTPRQRTQVSRTPPPPYPPTAGHQQLAAPATVETATVQHNPHLAALLERRRSSDAAGTIQEVLGEVQQLSAAPPPPAAAAAEPPQPEPVSLGVDWHSPATPKPARPPGVLSLEKQFRVTLGRKRMPSGDDGDEEASPPEKPVSDSSVSSGGRRRSSSRPLPIPEPDVTMKRVWPQSSAQPPAPADASAEDELTDEDAAPMLRISEAVSLSAPSAAEPQTSGPSSHPSVPATDVTSAESSSTRAAGQWSSHGPDGTGPTRSSPPVSAPDQETDELLAKLVAFGPQLQEALSRLPPETVQLQAQEPTAVPPQTLQSPGEQPQARDSTSEVPPHTTLETPAAQPVAEVAATSAPPLTHEAVADQPQIQNPETVETGSITAALSHIQSAATQQPREVTPAEDASAQTQAHKTSTDQQQGQENMPTQQPKTAKHPRAQVATEQPQTGKTTPGQTQTQKAAAGQPQPQKTASGQPQTQKTASGQPQPQKTASGQPQTQKAAAGQPETQKTAAGQPQTQKTAAGQPETQKTAAGQPQTQKTAAGQPQTQKTAEGQPQTQKTAAGQPQTQKTTSGQPQPEKTAAGQSQTQKSAAGQPQTQKTAAGQPQTQKTAAGQPQTQKTAAGQPQTQKTTAGQPQPQKTTAGQPQPQKTAAGQPQTQKTAGGQPQHQKTGSGQAQPQTQKAAPAQPPAQASASVPRCDSPVGVTSQPEVGSGAVSPPRRGSQHSSGSGGAAVLTKQEVEEVLRSPPHVVLQPMVVVHGGSTWPDDAERTRSVTPGRRSSSTEEAGSPSQQPPRKRWRSEELASWEDSRPEPARPGRADAQPARDDGRVSARLRRPERGFNSSMMADQAQPPSERPPNRYMLNRPAGGRSASARKPESARKSPPPNERTAAPAEGASAARPLGDPLPCPTVAGTEGTDEFILRNCAPPGHSPQHVEVPDVEMCVEEPSESTAASPVGSGSIPEAPGSSPASEEARSPTSKVAESLSVPEAVGETTSEQATPAADVTGSTPTQKPAPRKRVTPLKKQTVEAYWEAGTKAALAEPANCVPAAAAVAGPGAETTAAGVQHDDRSEISRGAAGHRSGHSPAANASSEVPAAADAASPKAGPAGVSPATPGISNVTTASSKTPKSNTKASDKHPHGKHSTSKPSSRHPDPPAAAVSQAGPAAAPSASKPSGSSKSRRPNTAATKRKRPASTTPPESTSAHAGSQRSQSTSLAARPSNHAEQHSKDDGAKSPENGAAGFSQLGKTGVSDERTPPNTASTPTAQESHGSSLSDLSEDDHNASAKRRKYKETPTSGAEPATGKPRAAPEPCESSAGSSPSTSDAAAAGPSSAPGEPVLTHVVRLPEAVERGDASLNWVPSQDPLGIDFPMEMLYHPPARGAASPNVSYCVLCWDGGQLLLCDVCERSYHRECYVGPADDTDESAPWQCLLCRQLPAPLNPLQRRATGCLNRQETLLARRLLMELYAAYYPSLYFRSLENLALRRSSGQTSFSKRWLKQSNHYARKYVDKGFKACIAFHLGLYEVFKRLQLKTLAEFGQMPRPVHLDRIKDKLLGEGYHSLMGFLRHLKTLMDQRVYFSASTAPHKYLRQLEETFEVFLQQHLSDHWQHLDDGAAV